MANFNFTNVQSGVNKQIYNYNNINTPSYGLREK